MLYTVSPPGGRSVNSAASTPKMAIKSQPYFLATLFSKALFLAILLDVRLLLPIRVNGNLACSQSVSQSVSRSVSQSVSQIPGQPQWIEEEAKITANSQSNSHFGG